MYSSGLHNDLQGLKCVYNEWHTRVFKGGNIIDWMGVQGHLGIQGYRKSRQEFKDEQETFQGYNYKSIKGCTEIMKDTQRHLALLYG